MALGKVDWSAWRNIVNNAKARREEDFLNESAQDPAKKKRMIQQYHVRCAVPGKRNKKGAFCIMEYKEEIRREEATLRDWVYVMMHEKRFVHWACKPKNLGMEPQDAAAKFEELCNAKDAITDLLGPNMKHARRVAVSTEDRIIDRDGEVKSKMLAGKQEKTKGKRSGLRQEV